MDRFKAKRFEMDVFEEGTNQAMPVVEGTATMGWASAPDEGRDVNKNGKASLQGQLTPRLPGVIPTPHSRPTKNS
ncbi:hypothetical protein EDD21DRAFT_417347 [Dissophora ornata]|nr:hypothetical protein EDD21DRAFT_417347 [Dissophora ornata]